MIWILGILLAGLAAAPFVREAMKPQMNDQYRKAAPGEFSLLSQGVTHYRWTGAARGPVIVCAHGLTTPSKVWDSIATGLAQLGFRVLVYDLYGRGFSDRPKGRQNAEFFLRQLEDLLNDQGVEDDITLLGYSMGGSIAAAFAARHPDRLRRLILLAPAGMGHNLGRAAQFARDMPVLGDWAMLAGFARTHRQGTEQERDLSTSVEGIVDYQQQELDWRGFVPAVLSSMRGILARNMQDEHRRIGRSDVPVLAIWGQDDAVIPLRAMGRLSEWNRIAHHEVIKDAGHGVAYTHAAQVLDAIAQEVATGN